MPGVVYPVHNNQFKIGTKGVDSTSEQMVMPADLENFSPAIDGQNEEWYAMDAEGWAKSIVTGKKFSIDFKGKRSVGDPGNDYIAGLAMKMGKDVIMSSPNRKPTESSPARTLCSIPDFFRIPIRLSVI